MCAVLSGDARLSDTADGEGEPTVPSQEAPPVPVFDSMEDFLMYLMYLMILYAMPWTR